MLIFKLGIAFVILSLRSTATVKGRFNYCSKDGCEEIDEIEVVQLFDTCTDYPFVKFLSKTLNKMCSGFINQLGDLVTEAQPSVVCDRNIKINKYDPITTKAATTTSITTTATKFLATTNTSTVLIAAFPNAGGSTSTTPSTLVKRRSFFAYTRNSKRPITLSNMSS